MNLRKAKKLVFTIALATCFAGAPSLGNSSAAQAQQQPQILGNMCVFNPCYKGAFSIDNDTGSTIRYQVRWGKNNPWKKMSLESGRRMTHSYPLGENPDKAVPSPYVKFDSIFDDGRITDVVIPMQFYAVLASPGAGNILSRRVADTAEPKRYYFRFGPREKDIYIYER